MVSSSPCSSSTGAALGLLMVPFPRSRNANREVAHLVVDGHTDREIAAQLRLSHHTVSQYVKRIYRKLDVASRVELTRLLVAADDH